jgi:hypothetical protein
VEENINNRQAGPRKRGRPSKEYSAANPFVPAVEVPLPPVVGLICLACGRGMQPRIINTARLMRTIACTLCGARMRAIYTEAGRVSYVKALP